MCWPRCSGTPERGCASSVGCLAVAPTRDTGEERVNTPWVVLLCKFKGHDDEPFPTSYYEDLVGVNATASPWHMARYFADWSHGTVDLSGSKVFGWFHLDKTVDDYNALLGDARPHLIKWAR